MEGQLFSALISINGEVGCRAARAQKVAERQSLPRGTAALGGASAELRLGPGVSLATLHAEGIWTRGSEMGVVGHLPPPFLP